MKTIAKILMLVAAVMLTFNSVSARTIEIKMSQCRKPLVENVRNMVSQVSSNDVVVLNFDKPGTYEFDGSIKIRCNTIIKGVGSKNTRVIVKEGFEGGKSKMLDDTFFAIHGYSNKKVKVEVRDIRFELASHKGTLWETAPKHIIKICDGDGITVDNATFWSTDAVITHLDLRDCSNVLVQNCTFENYNNCREGGELWSRGEQKNLVIKNNVFWKYGNDEALGFWGGDHKRDVDMKNIFVENNEFHYENKTKCKQDIPIDVLIAFCHFETEYTKHKCNVDSVVFKNNKIKMNAVTNCDIRLTFDRLAKIGYFDISYNTIENGNKCSRNNGYMSDIEIKGTQIGSNIMLHDNYIKSRCQVLWDGNNSGYTFLGTNNAQVSMINNVIESDYPVRLLWIHGGDNTIEMERNVASQIYNIVILDSSNLIGKNKIIATNNEFSGETSIYCNKVKELELNFTNNIFYSSKYHFFMIEGAETNSVTFEGNTVNALSGNGVIYANYSGRKCGFSKVNISNNIFNGIPKQGVDGIFPNVKKMSSRGNIYK